MMNAEHAVRDFIGGPFAGEMIVCEANTLSWTLEGDNGFRQVYVLCDDDNAYFIGQAPKIGDGLQLVMDHRLAHESRVPPQYKNANQ